MIATIKEFFRKKDKRLVAIFLFSNMGNRKYKCWEDDTGRRWYKVSGNGRSDTFLECALVWWTIYQNMMFDIPSYQDVLKGIAPYEYRYYNEGYTFSIERMR